MKKGTSGSSAEQLTKKNVETVSLEAIFLSTFILISQNLDSRISERRSHLDLQLNLLSEQIEARENN